MTAVSFPPVNDREQHSYGDDDEHGQREQLLQSYLEYAKVRRYCDMQSP